jgi:signal transduction histidine kinase
LDSEVKGSGAGGWVPLFEVLVPLHGEHDVRLRGIAQFVIEGESIAAEYAALERHLNREAWTAFLGSAVILVTWLGYTFRRLHMANQLLRLRTESLQRANEELVLAAKTSAVGTVTSHLLHGLKNPLSGLQYFLATRGDGEEAGMAWDEAEAAMRRMQSMIQDILELLRQDQEWGPYDLSAEELVATVSARLSEPARQRGVVFEAEVSSDRKLPNRVAQLGSLILVNLVENAIEASRCGQHVRLTIRPDPTGIACEVEDEGTGIQPGVEARLFAPLQTTKPTGSGLGLALCKQIASHLGAELSLKRNGPRGCVFALRLPEEVLRSGYLAVPV